MDYQVHDNVLGPTAFSLLQSMFAEEGPVAWKFLTNSAGGEIVTSTKNSYSWSCTVVNKTTDLVLEPVMAEIFHTLIVNMLDNVKVAPKEILRIRLGLHTYAGPVPCPPEPHVDRPTPHIVGLFYVDDSDGDTILYSNKFDRNSELGEEAQILDIEKSEGFKELDRVTPKANRLLLFDGDLFHASSPPLEHTRRTTINFNFN